MFLECTGNSGLVDFYGRLAGYVLAVENYCAVGGLINAGEQVENRGFSGAVGSDKAVELRPFRFRC